MIPFNKPPFVGKELEYLSQVAGKNKFSGDGEFSKKCHSWFEKNFSCKKALLTTSATHALEMAAVLCDIKPGDEVIMPSYTFVSTANAFVLRGAKIVFVDINPDTMNIDENLIEAAITKNTKVIVPVHYAGVSCNMDRIMIIANQYELLVVEDAAQGVYAKYNNKYLGTIGHIGCYSFHETKNYSCGEGGAIIINDERFIERAEIIREKGTNRSKFFRGQVDKYTWVDIGSSYLPSELNAAFLLAQLENAYEINNLRRNLWDTYFNALQPLCSRNEIKLPFIPEYANHNGHMFYIKVKNNEERMNLINYLKRDEIMVVFHYIPLHSSPAGQKFGKFSGIDRYTSIESERLLRLPLFYNLLEDEINQIIKSIFSFYQ